MQTINPQGSQKVMISIATKSSRENYTKEIRIETNDPEGPFGAKGLGEPGLIPTAPAIANAVYDALGVRVTELPITPEKVLEGLNKKTTA